MPVYKFKCSVAIILIFFTAHAIKSQGIQNKYTGEKGLPHLVIERSMIYSPDTNWFYSHHPSITYFKKKFIAVWSNGYKDEDNPGQRVVFSTSNDFFHWSKIKALAIPSVYQDTQNVLTAAGFHQYHDTLVAYYGEYTKDKKQTHLWAKISIDGEHWGSPIDMHVPVNPNHGPQKTKSGRLIISGNFTFPYTDDKKGLSGWKMTSFYPDSLYKEDNPDTYEAPSKVLGLPPLCEGAFYQTDDGIIHMLLRATDDGWKGRLWVTESDDGGEHWSIPTETGFSDNDCKFHFGRLPDKRFYYVGLPDTLHRSERNPLVFAISQDGKFFNKQYIIANDVYKIKKDGLWKDGQYGYPHTMILNGYVYVIVSRLKESMEVIRFKIPPKK
ncbi:MAG: exo-alpha-sialidase [Bacteroidetes bacterium]|nr:exo-alpha-sialidase [Bacteroidota bacterium]